MTKIETQPWGNAHIKFLPGQFSKEAVQKAAKQVNPTFHAPGDLFVMVDTEAHQTIAQVPGGSKPSIFGAIGTDQEALITALSKARDFLKKLYPAHKGPVLPRITELQKRG
jgi:hypothetical protein